MLRRLAATLIVAVFAFWAVCAVAQSVDFETWERVSESVTADLERDTLTDDAFQRLRADLADWRDRFLEMRDVNAVEIDTLSAQLDALGPAPAEGESESESVSTQRADITQALEQARAPRREAEQALARANALISRIDATLRERQAVAFLKRDGTPLNPSRWGAAVAQLGSVAGTIGSEVTANLERLRSGGLANSLPITILLLVLAGGLLVAAPRRIERLIAWVEQRAGENGRVVYGFIVSLGTVLAPLLAISLLNAALISTGVLGETGRAVALGANVGILAYAISRWLGNRIFPEREFIASPLSLEDDQRSRGRRLSRLLGILVAVYSVVTFVADTNAMETSASQVLVTPLYLFVGIILFRLGALIRAGLRDDTQEEAVAGYTNYVRSALGRAVQVVGVVGPLAAFSGYFNMAEGLLEPTVLSLALLAFLSTVHYVMRAAYAMVRGLELEEARQALAPVLASFVLAIASAPLFALAWGARTTDLSEAWNQIRTGIEVGDTTISPGDFFTFAIVFGLIYVITRLVQGALRNSVLPRTKIDKGGQNAITSGLGYLGVTIAAVAGINAAGIDLSSLALVIGALSVGIGFGLQNIVNNFVSGIILLIERPIGEGDWVEVNGQMGIVKSISVRSTRIETFDRTDVIVPNGDFISGTVTNWTRGNSIGRVIVPVGVAYGTDPRKVETILKEIAEDHPLVTITPPPGVIFMGFGADSMDFEIRAILKDVNYVLSVKSDMNYEIVRRFTEEGIEIPFAQRDLWLRNPEALQPAPPAPKGAPSQPLDPSLAAPEVDGD